MSSDHSRERGLTRNNDIGGCYCDDAIKDLRAFEMGHRIGMGKGQQREGGIKKAVKVPYPKKLTNN